MNFSRQEKIITSYGFKKPGASFFVFIAPHAAGDDKKTGVIASRLARLLGGFLVVNNRYFKKENKQAAQYPERVEDFNNLCWGRSYNKYLWKKKRPEMKKFFRDIAGYCAEAEKHSQDSRAVAVYIHGAQDVGVGVDIGVGAKRHNTSNKILGSKRHKNVGFNTGEITLKINTLKKIKKDLARELEQGYNLKVTVGESYSGWSKQSAIQFHKHGGRNDYALQFEIGSYLRHRKDKRKYIADLLAQVLLNNFK
ncbi:MAG: hypothetical protein PHD51_03845 [Patescibacteria group bacterium]|nr:hypothetical protein [Patescibacteria group bacterium]MDD5490896.1 hypothetical protein [Patescibacteria group bacterium]